VHHRAEVVHEVAHEGVEPCGIDGHALLLALLGQGDLVA
jgi:hypothetical protein